MSATRPRPQMALSRCNTLDVKSMPYCPRTQGKVERENQTTKAMLTKSIDENYLELQARFLPKSSRASGCLGSSIKRSTRTWCPYLPMLITKRNATPPPYLDGLTPHKVRGLP